MDTQTQKLMFSSKSNEWETLGGSTYTSDRINEVVGSSYADMMNNNQQPNGNKGNNKNDKEKADKLSKDIDITRMSMIVIGSVGFLYYVSKQYNDKKNYWEKYYEANNISVCFSYDKYDKNLISLGNQKIIIQIIYFFYTSWLTKIHTTS